MRGIVYARSERRGYFFEYQMKNKYLPKENRTRCRKEKYFFVSMVLVFEMFRGFDIIDECVG